MLIAGIDPGKHGSVVIIEVSYIGSKNVSPKMKIHSAKLCPIIIGDKKPEYSVNGMVSLLSLSDSGDPKERIDHIYIEKVHAMPKQGSVSMFSFGKGYGIWLGVMSALKIPYTEVAPQTWKKFWCSDMEKGKGSAVIRAQQLFHVFDWSKLNKATKETFAESMLIAAFGISRS